MARWTLLAVVVIGALAAPVAAQELTWQFRWPQGRSLKYRVDHHTTVTETVEGKRHETVSKLALVKRWDVTAADAEGTGTLKLAVTAMRQEQTRPDGEKLVFDSGAIDKSSPELREQMSKFIGQTLAVVRVDRFGKVVEVQQGGANRYDSELPFALRLPGQVVKAGQVWTRRYEVSLDPPHGTGEKFDASQRYELVKVDGGLATLRMTTHIKMPDSKIDQIPLLQKQPEGEIVFHVQAGRLESVAFRIDRELQGFEGQASSYRLVSVYQERFVDEK